MDERIHPSLMAESLAREIRGALGEFNNNDLAVVALVRDLAKSNSAHLTQPAQAVDVGKVKEVIAEMRTWQSYCAQTYADTLTRAIGNAQAEGWKVPEELSSDDLEPCAPISSEWLAERRGYRNGWNACRKAGFPTPPTKATPNAHE